MDKISKKLVELENIISNLNDGELSEKEAKKNAKGIIRDICQELRKEINRLKDEGYISESYSQDLHNRLSNLQKKGVPWLSGNIVQNIKKAIIELNIIINRINNIKREIKTAQEIESELEREEVLRRWNETERIIREATRRTLKITPKESPPLPIKRTYTYCPECRTELTKVENKWVCVNSNCPNYGKYVKNPIIPREDLREYDEIRGRKLPEILWHNLIPAAVGIIISVLISYVGGAFRLLGVAGIIFSLSFLLPREGIPGGVKALMRAGSLLFAGLIFPNKLIGLIILFIAYITSSSRYSEGTPYEIAFSWMKSACSIAIGILIYQILHMSLGWNISLVFAVFVASSMLVIPHRKEEREGSPVIVINVGKKQEMEEEALSVILNAFSAISLACLMGILYWLLWEEKMILQALIFLFLGGLVVYNNFSMGGREYRGEVNFPLLLILLLTLTTAYPSVLGKALFGQWWPTVEASVSPVLQPLADAWDQAVSGVSDAWLLLTNPEEYYARQVSTRVSEEGSVKSVELTEFDIPMDLYYPPSSIVGTVTLENQGEFDAKNVRISLPAKPKVKKGEDLEDIEYGFTLTLICSGGQKETDESGTPSGCSARNFYQGSIMTASFSYSLKEGEKWDCYCGTEPVACDSECDKPLKYAYGGDFIYIPVTYSFEYTVNATYEIEVMNKDTYYKDLRSGRLTRQEKISKYSGGPVSVGISIAGKQQPVPSEEPVTVKIGVTNTGAGTVKDATLTVTFPWNAEYLGGPSDCSEIDQSGQNKNSGENGAKEWECTIQEVGKETTSTLQFTMTPGDISDVKTELVLATLYYTYEREETEKVQVAWGPAQ